MDVEDVNNLSSNDYCVIESVLKSFLENNEKEYSFPSLSANGLRVQLWSSLFQHLNTPSSQSIHGLCLTCLKILSRDCADLENIICEKWISTLVEKAGLYELVALKDEETLPTIQMTDQEKEVVLEALKCLCNLVYNTPENCVQSCLVEGLIARFRLYHNNPYGDEIAIFDTKLLFILTALRSDVKDKIKYDLNGTKYLLNYVDGIVKELKPVFNDDVTNEEDWSMKSDELLGFVHHYLLTDAQQSILCDMLKTFYNLMMTTEMTVSPSSPESTDLDTFVNIVRMLSIMLQCGCSSRDKQIQLQNNVANLLTSVPELFFPELTPSLSVSGPEPPAHCQYYDRNMEPLYILILFLQHKISSQKDLASQYENLSPILTVMLKASRAYRLHRKFLRNVILPPLKDVSKAPEEGDSLRNQLCRLATSPVSQIKSLSGELLLTLCKGKVARLVKYIGYGNAAGLLAAKGLLAGGSCGEYSSSSEDSDTEEYLQACATIDPVVGCTRPPPTNPFEGYSEEQKEYEAMKLVGLLEELSASGVVQPATVGEDGRPRAVEHLLELRDGPTKKP